MNPAPPPLFDVPALLESSQPRPRVAMFWYALGGFVAIVVISFIAQRQSDTLGQVVSVLSMVAMLGLMVALAVATVVTVRRHRGEQEQVEAAGELVQLRRWPEAALVLAQYLSRPARTLQLRSQALLYLTSVLARYHRFEDAILVQNYLLEHELVDPAAAMGLRMGRAMAMLREDHLVDADRALGDLRREAGGRSSAGLALIEIYRDVKTNHPDEAVAIFEDKLPILREQLGHRVADAWVLAARAYDMLGRTVEAQDAYHRATLLAPLAELERRYPEVAKLNGRYQVAPAPPELL